MRINLKINSFASVHLNKPHFSLFSCQAGIDPYAKNDEDFNNSLSINETEDFAIDAEASERFAQVNTGQQKPSPWPIHVKQPYYKTNC